MYTKIAHTPDPRTGSPKIHAPGVYGASTGKPLLWRIPTTGARPIAFAIDNLPDGLTLDTESGILSGQIATDGEYTLQIHAENALGTDTKTVRLVIAPDTRCLTPLLGWTSWNAMRQFVSHEKIAHVADRLVESGLADYGYQYVNIDSGWQGVYGGKFGAVVASPAFPDMHETVAHIHSYGLKAGIYSTPMQKAWGDTEAPGCTQGPLDPRYNNTYFGIGQVHCEKENAAQWADWGFDYCKYDWGPCDTENAKLMKDALEGTDRDFAFCVTVSADWWFRDFWVANCTSFRSNNDSMDRWDNVLGRFDSDRWASVTGHGHYFDLDMLEVGTQCDKECRLTEDEQLVTFTIRAVFPSPIQLSCDLDRLTPFEKDLFMNDEVLSVNQDALGICAYCADEHRTHDKEHTLRQYTKLYIKPLSDGSHALAFFNLGEEEAELSLPAEYDSAVRDVWAKEDLTVESLRAFRMMPHTARLFRVFPRG